jgi:fluoroacetyl-CoA thioesterase
MPLRPGLTASVHLVVGAGDTAVALGSGDVHVLGTPRVLALAEEATVAAIAAELDPDSTSVGVRVELDHVRPVFPGVRVGASAVLREVVGRRLVFDIAIVGEDGEVARAVIERAVVHRPGFPGGSAQSGSAP